MNTLSTFAGIWSSAFLLFVTRKPSEDTARKSSRTWLLAAAAILAVLFTPGLTVAQQSDPFVGIWKLNVAKSTFDPGTERKSETRAIESSPFGLKVSVDRTNADNTNQQYNYTTNLDGKPHPITGTAPYGADSLAATLGASNTISFKLTKGGQAVGSGTSVVSADGKTLTLTSKGIDASGKTVSSVSVYDKR
jgi:hypothetical protein